MRKPFKKTVVALIAASVLVHPVHAGFMDDFYTSAGAGINVTPAQVVQGQGGTFITGGSAVWRAPSRSFTPFLFQGPSLKAGCGGIDFFMGSFGFANSTEFVTYLRNVGQNASGLLFQLALRAMSPELSQTIKEISDDIQKMNAFLGDSCAAAKALVGASPAQKWSDEQVAKRTGAGMESGGIGSYYNSYSQLKTSLNNTLGTSLPVVERTNSGGAPVGAGERNITWLVINTGTLASTTPQYMQIIMSMMGTRIYKQKPGEDTVAVNLSRQQKVYVKDLAGRWNDNGIELPVWNCGIDIQDKCLEPVGELIGGFKPLSRLAYESMKTIRDAIVTRTDIMSVAGGFEAMRMIGTTRLPAFKILELTSSNGMTGLSEMMMQKYADLMGWELASQFVLQLTEDVTKQITDSRKGTGIALSPEDLDFLEKKIAALNLEAAEIQTRLAIINGSQADLINEMQMMERSFYNSFNLRLMDNLKTAQRR
jgi:conjugative transfer pilus assembly protein TraH